MSTVTIPRPGQRPIVMKDRTDDPSASCEIHDWPAEGLARGLMNAIEERGEAGINACRECLLRARAELRAQIDAAEKRS